MIEKLEYKEEMTAQKLEALYKKYPKEELEQELALIRKLLQTPDKRRSRFKFIELQVRANIIREILYEL